MTACSKPPDTLPPRTNTASAQDLPAVTERTVQGWRVSVRLPPCVWSDEPSNLTLTLDAPRGHSLGGEVKVQLASETLRTPFRTEVTVQRDTFFHDPAVNRYWVYVQDIYGSDFRARHPTRLRFGTHTVFVTVAVQGMTVELPPHVIRVER